jgi:hypothetical protein
VYTHFGSRFARKDASEAFHVRLDVRETLERCGRDPSIAFVPAGELLDRLRIVQILEDVVDADGRVVGIPEALWGSRDGISVDLSRLPARYVPETLADGGGGDSPRRVSLDLWIAASGLQLRASSASVFDEPRHLPWRERWRLVLKWLLTQVVSPT